MTLGIFLYSFYELSSVIIRIVLLGYIPLRHSPNTAMAWLLAIYFWPWMGFLLYAALGSTALPSE
ncbi:MAG: PLDc N-terminal domain-containing protein, partial [Aminobacteriaceae bacterium]